MSSSNLVRLAYKKESSYGVTPAAVKASLILQDLTYTAVKGGTPGNSISIEYIGGATAGNEVVTVTGNAIVVQIQDGVSTATQIKAKVDASAAAMLLVSVAITGTGSNAQVDISQAATGTLLTTAHVILTSVAEGSARNTNTFTVQVLPAAANPADTVIVSFTGTAAAIICTVTPNDGTNNTLTPVNLTTAELRELINTGLVSGKTITLTDASSRRILQTATGGGATALADGGEGDGLVATFSGGINDAATPLASGSLEFKTARFTSEKYSGTPATTESAQIRTDRMSSGQVVTGLKVDGGHNIELAKEAAIEDFLESAMLSAWDTTSITGTFSTILNATTHTMTRGSGSYISDGVKVGDILVMSGFTNTENNVPVQAMIVTDLVLTYAGPAGMITETHSATYTRGNKLTIGTTQKSMSVEKTFLDLTTKAILYKGVLVSQMELDIAYGQLISGNFGTSANGYSTADAANEFLSYQEYINSPATTQSMNGSVDMPFTMTDVTGSFAQDGFCIQSLKVQLNNNLQPQTCIGNAAPEAYSPGTAAIKIDLSSYLKDSNWDLLARKLSQQSFALGFMVKNTDGWYGFFFPAIQVSFDDPSSGGANQQISMSMSGTAKVGSGGESAMSIYRVSS